MGSDGKGKAESSKGGGATAANWAESGDGGGIGEISGGGEGDAGSVGEISGEQKRERMGAGGSDAGGVVKNPCGGGGS